MALIKTLRLLPMALILFSCGGGPSPDIEPEEIVEESRYGGVFRMSLVSSFNHTNLHEIIKLETAQIYSQIYEGLVTYDKETFEVEPALAKKWSVSEDGLIYTFELREDVYFHDNECFKEGKGRLVTPKDVVFTFNRIYGTQNKNYGYSLLENTIVGGDAYHLGKADSISGIKVNGNEIVLELEVPSLIFIEKLASIYCGIVAEEAVSTLEHKVVGTGPFVYDEKSSTPERVLLVKNEKFYRLDEDGGKLPYLDSAEFVYYDDNDSQMEDFWNGNISYITSVPITKISEVLEEKIEDFESKPPKHILSTDPLLSTTYLEMNCETKVFKNKKVRQAINYAINRKKLVEKIMKNQAYEIGKFGITPPLKSVFGEYDFDGIEDVSYVYNPAKAKELLADAGYPEGKDFPALEMQFREGTTGYLVASEIQNQLRSVLNINLDIEAVEFNRLLDNNAMGSADMFRVNWVGEYASPENFLANAYGKSVPKDRNEPSPINSSRYSNKEFDALYEKGLYATNKEEANKYFGEAEKVLMRDAPFIILWYNESMSLTQASLRNFGKNSIEIFSLTESYFKTPTAEEFSGK